MEEIIMKLRNQAMKYNLQFFASKGEDGDGTDNTGDDGDDDQDDAKDDKSGDKDKKSDSKTYTQKEIDDIITERLKRERKKAEKKQEQSKDDKQGDKGADDKSKDDANTKKLSALEEKVLCYDHDIAKEYVKEAIALAKAYIDEDTDMDEALDKVIKKFPQFSKSSDSKKKKSDSEDGEEEDDTDNKSWGQRQKGSKDKDPTKMSYDEYKAYRQGNKKG
jgi:hypothetical protein